MIYFGIDIRVIMILLLVLILMIILNKKYSLEKFMNKDGGNYLNKMHYDNETMLKFCKKLNQLDKPNEYNLLLMKMKQKNVNKNNLVIQDLLTEIDTIQKDIVNDDISMKNIYRLYTHEQAQKKLDVIDKAIENVKNRNKVKVNLT